MSGTIPRDMEDVQILSGFRGVLRVQYDAPAQTASLIDASQPQAPPWTGALRVLLVGREGQALAHLRTLLAACHAPAAVVVGQASDAVAAVHCAQHQAFDLALIDLQCAGYDVLALARSLRSLACAPALVVVSADMAHAQTAFDLDATDFLGQPPQLARLQLALNKVVRRVPWHAACATGRPLRQESPPSQVCDAPGLVLVVQDRQGSERVPVETIVYFKAEHKYVTARTACRRLVLDASLAQLQIRFGARFLRIHRNALVARHAVRALHPLHGAQDGQRWALRLDGVDERLPVARRHLAALRAWLARL